jgi:hypothetical protein
LTYGVFSIVLYYAYCSYLVKKVFGKPKKGRFFFVFAHLQGGLIFYFKTDFGGFFIPGGQGVFILKKSKCGAFWFFEYKNTPCFFLAARFNQYW